MIKEIPAYKGGHWFSGHFKQFKESNLYFPVKVGRELGGIGQFRIFHKRVVCITDSEIYEQIMIKNHLSFLRGIQFRNNDIIFGCGMLFTEGEEWLKKRVRSNPAFQREALKKVVPLSSTDARVLLDKWSAAAKTGSKVAVNADMQLLTVSIICHALFSRMAEEKTSKDLCALFRESSMITRKRNSNLFPHPSWLPSKTNAKLKQVRDRLNQFVFDRLKERDELAQGQKLGDIFDLLLQGKKFDDVSADERQEILDECKTLFVAGFETTSLTLTWVLYLLANNPAIAKKWHDECDRVLKNKECPTWEDLDQLEYTKQIVLETMRLYPVVFTQPRVCESPEVVAGHQFRKGDVVLLSIFGIHRSEQYWENPEQFDPDRFGSDKNWPKRHYMPFGKGKHTCIGNNFATYEMLVILSMIGKEFELSYLEKEKVVPASTVVLIPDREVFVSLRKRDIP